MPWDSASTAGDTPVSDGGTMLDQSSSRRSRVERHAIQFELKAARQDALYHLFRFQVRMVIRDQTDGTGVRVVGSRHTGQARFAATEDEHARQER